MPRKQLRKPTSEMTIEELQDELDRAERGESVGKLELRDSEGQDAVRFPLPTDTAKELQRAEDQDECELRQLGLTTWSEGKPQGDTHRG